jgi:hypothetical protein
MTAVTSNNTHRITRRAKTRIVGRALACEGLSRSISGGLGPAVGARWKRRVDCDLRSRPSASTTVAFI